MNKVDFSDINLTKESMVNFDNKEFSVKKFLSDEEIQNMIKNYLYRFFDGKEENNPFINFVKSNRIMAEYGLIGDIIVAMTDIDLDTLPNEVFLDPIFFETIYSEIDNWDSFIVLLKEVLDDAIREKELEKSIGYVLDYSVERIFSFIEGLDPKYFEDISEQIKVVGKQLEESRLSGLMDDAQRNSGK